ncbi:MAG: UDP-N-acetylmuramate dehydrogenase [Acidobacteriota bacterium]
MNVASSPVGQLTAAFREAGVGFRLEEPLGRYTSIGLGGPAEVLAFPASTDQMLASVCLARELGLRARVLGGGSNLIVSDEGVRGVVIHTGAMKRVAFGEGGEVEAEAGMHFPALVRAAATRGLRGLEGGVGIPGSLGGVLAMNAGAYHFSIGEWVERVTVLAPLRGKVELERGQIDFRYRSSSLGDEIVVARCLLRLAEDDPKAIRADMDREMVTRKTTQPVGVKSAGCIFKNPSGDSAGRVIEAVGLKGLRVGGVRVSEVHANFMVHDGQAQARDVLVLIEKVKERVYRGTGIELEEEIKRWP